MEMINLNTKGDIMTVGERIKKSDNKMRFLKRSLQMPAK